MKGIFKAHPFNKASSLLHSGKINGKVPFKLLSMVNGSELR